MRTLLLMRGCPGCGKSTFIKEHNLEQYTLCPDDIRVLCSSLELQASGEFKISQDQQNEGVVWDTLFKLLEHRMSRGEFTVIDATCSKTKDIQRYKDLADSYRYRMFIVDFTDIPIETCIAQNKMRPSWKQVPQKAIENIYSRFATQKIPSGITVIKRDELDTLLEKPIDLSKYNKLVFVGDIHGCYDTLMQYEDFKNGLRDDVAYIFLGDYTDRGNQNYEVLKYLGEIKDRENVCLLEGNHECFSKNTEFLTESGWKKFDDIGDDEKLAQVDLKTNLVSFDYPIARISKISDDVVRISNVNHSQEITLLHNVIYDNTKVPLNSLDLTNLKFNKFKYSCINDFNGVSYSDAFLRLLIFTYADGTIVYGEKNRPNNHKCRVQFKISREDKMKLLESVLEENNINYSKKECTKSGSNVLTPYIYRFYGDKAREIYDILGKNKTLPISLMYMNKHQFNTVLDIMSKTDGCSKDNKVIYSSINYDNLSLLQVCASLNGYRATLHNIGIGGFGKNTRYELRISLSDSSFKGSVSKLDVNRLQSQEVCCFQMQKGTLITRLDGNVIVSGNCWVKNFGNNMPAKSKEFEDNTKAELYRKGYTEKEARILYRKLRQFSHITYNGLELLACHGGIPNLNTNLLYLPTIDFIKGVGNYQDYIVNTDSWMGQTKDNQYLIHGHRNTEASETQIADRVFNLEGRVEFGGNLRIVELDNNLNWNIIELENCQPITEEYIPQEKENMTIEDAVQCLRKSRFVQEKELDDNVSSFNFTRDAFMKGNWNKQTILARGLFIDTLNNKIMARSYEKFFKVNEIRETELGALKDKLCFPVSAYKKENGFLVIVSYDYNKDDLFIATKSTTKGDYVEYAKRLLEPYKEKLLEEFRTSDASISYVFECVDIDNDPHIIKYDKSCIILLDGIFNELEYKSIPYEHLKDVANYLGCRIKEKVYELQNWDEFRSLYNKAIEEDYTLNDEYIEGYVFVDSNGFMVKVKTGYYNEWKKLRGVANNTLRCGYINKTGMLQNSTENLFYGFCRDLFNKYYDRETKSYPFKTDIISLRDKFEKGE